MFTHIRNYFPANFTVVTKWWFRQQKHILVYVWWSCNQPKLKMIGYLDSTHQNSWKALSFKFICSHTSETNFQPTLQQWQNDVQATETLIIWCLMIFHSTKIKSDNLERNSKIVTYDGKWVAIVEKLLSTKPTYFEFWGWTKKVF